jgi:hypothetical protein
LFQIEKPLDNDQVFPKAGRIETMGLITAAGEPWLSLALALILLFLFRFTYSRMKGRAAAFWQQQNALSGSLGLYLAFCVWTCFNEDLNNKYLVFSFFPFLAADLWRRLKGEVSGQGVLTLLSFVIAAIGLQGDSSFVDRLAWPEVPSVLLAAALMGVVVKGASGLSTYVGAPSLWSFLLLLPLTFLEEKTDFSYSAATVGLLILANGLWGWKKEQGDMDSLGSSFLAFWLVGHSLTLEGHGAFVSSLSIWSLLFALPLIEWLTSFLGWKTTGGESFIPHLRGVGFHRRQALLYLGGLTIYTGLAAWTLSLVQTGMLFGLVTTLSMVGVALFVGFTYLVHHHKSTHVHHISQTLLKGYLPVQDKVEVDLDRFQAVAYDLLPYYRILENVGIGEVQRFLHDFSHFLESYHPGAPALLVGSYTVLVVEDEPQPPGRYLTQLNGVFQDFLANYELEMKQAPSYFSCRSKKGQFWDRFAPLLVPKGDSEGLAA